jgi:hypothetical protein
MSAPSLKSGSASKSFLWTFPECPVRIHVNFEFIDRLRKEALDVAHGDREVGGLLIGNELSRHGDVEVSDYIPLPAGSELTKTFSVCSSSLTKAIQSGRAAGQKVIGFYRTHLEPRIQLRPEDLECVRSKFNDPANVFLVIRPHDGRASAGFFFWQDGAVVGGLTFPFSSAELHSPSWSSLVGGSPRRSALESVISRARDTVSRVSPRMKIGLLTVVAMLIVLAVGLRIYNPTPATTPALATSQTAMLRTSGTSETPGASQTPGGPQALGLRVEKSLMGVIIAWNITAPEIETAKDADLLIWDGSSPPAFVRLTIAQLHAGRAFFNSLSDRVEVRMDVIGPAGKARSESVVSTAAAPEVVAPEQRVTGVRASVPPRPPIPLPAELRNENSFTGQPVKEVKPPARIFIPTTPVAKARIAPGELPQPPEIQAPDAGPLALLQTFHSFNDPQATAPPPAPEPPRPVREGPVQQPVQQSVPQPAPQAVPDTQPKPAAPAVATKPAATTSIQVAEPIREIRPQVPPQLKTLVQSENVVEVLVHISDAGKVTSAKLGTVKGPSAGFLSKLSVNAALGWQFKPAVLNGKAIESDKIIVFRFQPTNR